MRLIYLLLLSILIASYYKTWQRAISRSRGLTPLLGWMIGLAFFLVAPLCILTINGGFTLPAAYDVTRVWGSVDLSNSAFFLPYAVIWLSLMLCCFVIYVCFAPEPNRGELDTLLITRIAGRTLWLTFGIAVASWLFGVWMAGGIVEFMVSHWYARSEDLVARYGDGYILLSHLFQCNQVIFTSAAALYTGIAIKTKTTSARLLSLIILELIGETLVSGNRIHIAIYMLSLLTSCWVHKRGRVMAGIVAFAPLLILVFSLWAFIRGNLSEVSDRTSGYFESDRGNPVTSSLMDVTEGVDTMLAMHIVKDFGNDVPYLHGESYVRAFTSLIPRRVYPSKSKTFTTKLAEVYLPGEMTSLNATALGEMYANFGPASILLMPLFTLGVVFVNHWAIQNQINNPIRPAVLFVLLIAAARVTLEDSFVLFVLASLMMWILRHQRSPRSDAWSLVGVE